MNGFFQTMQELSMQGGIVFHGLLVLAFGIAFSLLSILRLLRFPEAPDVGEIRWQPLLLGRQDPSEAERVRLQESLSHDARILELELRLFGKLRRRIPFALTLIAAAPLLGLLGTVTGMFATFHGLSLSATRAPVDVISGGVSEALITTQTGLVIGIPSYIICSLLSSRLNRFQAGFHHLKSTVRLQAEPVT